MDRTPRTASGCRGRLLGLLAIWLAVAVAPPPARAGTAEDRIFREANEAYAAGRYPAARARYEQLVATGARDERLYYNLGNTYFKLGALGRAIWAYEKALRIDPDLAPARYNLEIARGIVERRVKDKVVGTQRPGFTDRVVRAFSVTTATALFFSVYWLAFGLLLAVLLLRRGVLRATAIALTVLAFLSAGVLGWIYSERVDRETRLREAIALEDTVAVREGPRAIATKAFEIHAGLKVRLQAREDRWWKIRLPNGLEGWVRTNQVGEL